MLARVVKGTLIDAAHQNALIDQVNANVTAISNIQLGSGDPEAVQAQIDTTVQTHVEDTTPHPAYDDLPSLSLLFENGLV